MTQNKNYTPQLVEEALYLRSESSGAFQACHTTTPKENNQSKPTYCVMMPPPNITGSLHIGHALNYTLQDILVRVHRMRGFDTLWQPGTDHAGIATQMVVTRNLQEQGIDAKSLGRSGFLKHVWAWQKKYGDRIVHQQRRLGITADWQRQRFTMDEDLSKVVRHVFIKLYRDGLIYRKKRLVNWDIKLQTAVSDLEVISKETQGHYWTIRYPIQEDNNRFICVATTRPETLFGDTAIAVHPDDPRYQDLIGKKAIVPFVDRAIPIIADTYCTPDKGTGAVKITPAHDFNDFDVGERHHLDQITIFDFQGRLIDSLPEPFGGLDRMAARKKVVDELRSCELLDTIEETLHTVPYGERSDDVLEPLLMDQWFINMKDLAKRALEAVSLNETTLFPDNMKSTYDHWLNNIQPWCISRQLWWGHQIPVWYGPDQIPFVASTQEEAHQLAEKHYGQPVSLTQDKDVLDTWFSSALWPFSTLGWPEKTLDFERFYPTTVLSTGTDILFFWVARMMMMGLYCTGTVPFKHVFLHALVRDDKGQKMSKTKGNVVDPLDIIDTYGADVLRLTMTSLAAPGREIRFSDRLVESNRNFLTKLWNASKYMKFAEIPLVKTFDPDYLKTDFSRWLYTALYTCLQEINTSLATYRFDDVSITLHRFTWSTFCDWAIELSKSSLKNRNKETCEEVRQVMGFVFAQLLKMLNPIIPFITQHIHDQSTGEMTELLTEPWPELKPINNEQKQNQFCAMGWTIKLISEIRSLRGEMNVTPKAQPDLYLVVDDFSIQNVLKRNEIYISKLARVGQIKVIDTLPKGLGQVHGLVDPISFCIDLTGAYDVTAEINRLEKDIDLEKKEIFKLSHKLKNPEFLARAPKHIVAKTQQRLEETEARLGKLSTTAERLKMSAITP